MSDFNLAQTELGSIQGRTVKCAKEGGGGGRRVIFLSEISVERRRNEG